MVDKTKLETLACLLDAYEGALKAKELPSDAAVPRETVIDDARKSIVAAFVKEWDERPITGENAVFRMRDEFLQLAKCYLDIYDYRGAQAAISLVQSLEKFENEHIITGITWPAIAVINREDNDYYLEGNEETRSES